MKKPVVVILLIAVALMAFFVYQHRQQNQDDSSVTLFGNVDIRQVSLAFDGSGRVLSVNAEEGDKVAKGQVLAQLDTRLLELQADQVRGQLAAAKQALLKLQNGARPEEIAQARSQLAAAKASAEQAQKDYQRTEGVFKVSKGSVSESDVDRAKSALDVAVAEQQESQHALDLLLAGAREEDIASAKAEVQIAEANLALLQIQIERGTLTAPTDAQIRSRLLEPGDMATSATPVFTLALIDPKWVRVYLSETQLSRVKEGMQASITSDSYPDSPITGRVRYISSVAEFTPKAIQTEELRSSLVYEVRIYVDDPDDHLRLGQPVTVSLDLAQPQPVSEAHGSTR